MKITGFSVFNPSEDEIPADPYGNNVAFKCYGCDHPVLAIARKNQRGYDEKHPTTCKKCGKKYFMDIEKHNEKLFIRPLP